MATIYYHDIGDYLSREQKLKMVHDFRSVKGMEWTEIVPNEKEDWINVRDGVFDTMVLLGDKDDKANKRTFFVPYYSNGLKTQRDAWCYNSSQTILGDNMRRTIEFYNSQVHNVESVDKVEYNDTKFSWTRACLNDFRKKKTYHYKDGLFMESLYRPFFRQCLFYYRPLNEMMYQMPKLYPTKEQKNTIICVQGLGATKEYSVLMSNSIVDLGFNAACQCFPLYYYEENTHKQKTLFDDTLDDDYIRHDGITDWILKEVRSRYNGAKNITKEMIFYYVYGLLHSKDYRERFAADLKKSLPRIPIVERIEDFMAFYKAGKQLAELHLNYEEVPPHPEVVVHITAQRADQDDYDYFRVDPKMKFRSKDDKSVILYNANIRLEHIPLKAYDYIVNGKSAIEWIVERYCVSIDKKSLIKNDANDWGREHQKPRYILDLLLSVINVSTQTVDIVNSLPRLTFD